MPKKTPAAKPTKKTATKKAAAKTTAAKKKLVPKPATTVPVRQTKKTASQAKTAQKSKTPAIKKKTSLASPPAEKPEVSLGRPLVTQEEKLYMLFHEDFLARQVFEFLRVETVKELEQFSQQQIIHMMTKPLRATVDRIRQRLAQFKRSLKDDEQFAAEFRRQAEIG